MTENESNAVPDPGPQASPRSCVLQAATDGVQIVVDGQVAQVVPLDAYETTRQELSTGGELHAFVVEMSDQSDLKLLLPPLAEVNAGPVTLHSRDGVTYGRRYKLVNVQREEDGRTCAAIVAADTGALVERQPWDEFRGRVKAGESRSATLYGDMLGRFNGRLYFTVTGAVYQPPEPVEGQPEAAEEEAGAEEAPPSKIREFRMWIRKRPRIAYIASGIAGLLLCLSGGYYISGSCVNVPELNFSDSRSLAYFVDDDYQIAHTLAAIDFKTYCRDHPKVARDNVAKLKAFLVDIRGASLSPAEAKKVDFIKGVVPRLDGELQRTTRP